MTRILAALAAGLMLVGILPRTHAQAQAVTNIDGVPIFCTDIRGLPVQTIARPGIGDVAIAREVPAPTGQPVPVIFVDPIRFAAFGIDTQTKLFVYAHECGHHVFGHQLAAFNINAEIQADCWGIKVGRDQGWFDLPTLQRLAIYFSGNPGDIWGHLPGPARTAHFAACFTDPLTAQAYAWAVINRQIPF